MLLSISNRKVTMSNLLSEFLENEPSYVHEYDEITLCFETHNVGSNHELSKNMKL